MDKDQARRQAKMAILEPLFETDGWTILTEELTNEIENIKETMLTVEDWDTVCFLKGRIMQILDVLYLPDTIANLALVEDDEYADV